MVMIISPVWWNVYHSFSVCGGCLEPAKPNHSQILEENKMFFFSVPMARQALDLSSFYVLY